MEAPPEFLTIRQCNISYVKSFTNSQVSAWKIWGFDFCGWEWNAFVELPVASRNRFRRTSGTKGKKAEAIDSVCIFFFSKNWHYSSSMSQISDWVLMALIRFGFKWLKMKSKKKLETGNGKSAVSKTLNLCLSDFTSRFHWLIVTYQISEIRWIDRR